MNDKARASRWATTAIFIVNGAALGSWLAQVPWVQERFELSSGAMGLVLVGMSVAVILVMPIAGRAVVKHGSQRMTLIGGTACSLAVILPVAAPHPVLAAGALLVLGATSATMDVSMNSHGVHVERQLDRPIMSSLHAGWAFGGIIGAGFAAALGALGVDPRLTVLAASGTLLGVVLAAARWLGRGSAAAGEDTPGFTLPTRSVILLAVLCLLIMLTEGAMAGWGGLYIRQDLDATAALAALAYAFFTAGMFVGRLAGDDVSRRIGAVSLLRLGALLTGVPLALMLLIGTPAAALAGLFAIGLGVANGVPLLFSAAGRQREMPSGVAIAAVASIGSLGFLAGPPAIGFLAQATSLPWALATLVVGAAAVLALAHRAVGPDRQAS
ncbi:MAG TPA: MFS transporter [Solirubrobacteraceae bacterium]|nr:MFS transporter [Solirubrobacteraceae bacterium]